MDWGSFAGGVSQGLDQGSLIKQRQQAAQLQALQQQALAARGKEGLAVAEGLAQGGGAPGGAPQAPGGVTSIQGIPQGGPPQAMASGGAPPTQVPMPGAMPMPQGAGAPPGGPAPQPMPQGGPPQPPPGPPPAQPGGAPNVPSGGAPLSGVARPTGNFQQDIGNSAYSMYASLLKADPSLKSNPRAAALAVDQMIEQAKGFDQTTRTAMQSANEVFKAQISLQEAQLRAQAATQNAQLRADTQQQISQDKIQAQLQETTDKLNAIIEKAKLDAGSREKVAGIGANSRIQAAGIGAASRERVAGTNAGARVESANIGAGSRERVAGTSAKARVQSAQIAMGQQPTGGAAAPMKVKTPAEAAKLKPGTQYETPDGQVYVR